jgi:hypothetical protein
MRGTSSVNLAVVLILNGECVDEQVLGSSFLLKLCESDVVKSNLSQAAQQAGTSTYLLLGSSDNPVRDVI